MNTIVMMRNDRGEGSRGGKIIGHTSSGKPIYASKNQMSSKGQSLDDILKETKNRPGTAKEAKKFREETIAKSKQKIANIQTIAGQYHSGSHKGTLALELAIQKKLNITHDASKLYAHHIRKKNITAQKFNSEVVHGVVQ